MPKTPTPTLQEQIAMLESQLAHMHQSLADSHKRETEKSRRIFDLEQSNAGLKQNMRDSWERLRVFCPDLTVLDIRAQLSRGFNAKT